MFLDTVKAEILQIDDRHNLIDWIFVTNPSIRLGDDHLTKVLVEIGAKRKRESDGSTRTGEQQYNIISNV